MCTYKNTFLDCIIQTVLKLICRRELLTCSSSLKVAAHSFVWLVKHNAHLIGNYKLGSEVLETHSDCLSFATENEGRFHDPPDTKVICTSTPNRNVKLLVNYTWKTTVTVKQLFPSLNGGIHLVCLRPGVAD